MIPAPEWDPRSYASISCPRRRQTMSAPTAGPAVLPAGVACSLLHWAQFRQAFPRPTLAISPQEIRLPRRRARTSISWEHSISWEQMCGSSSEGIPRCLGSAIPEWPTPCRCEFSGCARLHGPDNREFLPFHDSRNRWSTHTILRERKLHL